MDIGGISLVANPLYRAADSKLSRRESSPPPAPEQHLENHSEADGESDLVAGGKLDTVA